MKKLFLLSVVLSCLALYTGCDDDDDHPDRYYSGTGTLIKGDDSFYYVSDGGSVMEIDSSSDVDKDSLSSDSTRASIVYIVKKRYDEGDYDYKIKITDYEEILTKSIFHFTSDTGEDVRDSIGNDVVHIKDAWITDNYLTIYFSYYGGSVTHYINLVQDADSLQTEDGELLLELKHNANDDTYNNKLYGLVSFDISELQDSGTNSVTLLLRYIKNSDGDYGKGTITYSYGDSSTSTEIQSITNTKSFDVSSDNKVK